MKIDSINYKVLQMTLFFLVVNLDFIPVGLSKTIDYLFYFGCLGFILISCRKINLYSLSNVVVFLLILWSSFYFISSLLSADVVHGLKIYINSSLLYVLIFISLLTLPLVRLERIYDYLISITGVIVVGGTLIFFLFGDTVVSLIATPEFESLRRKNLITFSGVFYNQNQLGLILAFYSSWIFHKLIANKNKERSSLVLSVSLLVSVFFLTLTISRASILMFVCFGFFYLLLKGDIKQIIAISILSLLFMVLFFNIRPDVYEFLLSRITNGSTSNRVEIWRDALSYWLDVPFFGLGPNQYKYIYNDQVLSSHNFYINSLVNTGLLTILMYLLFLFSIQIKGFSLIIRKNIPYKGNVIYATSLISSLMIHQVFESQGFSNNKITGFGVLILMAIIYNVTKERIRIPNRRVINEN